MRLKEYSKKGNRIEFCLKDRINDFFVSFILKENCRLIKNNVEMLNKIEETFIGMNKGVVFIKKF